MASINSDSPNVFVGLGVNRVTTRFDNRDSPMLNRAIDGHLISGAAGGQTHYSLCRTATELAQAMQKQEDVSITGLGLLPLLGAKRKFYESLKSTTFSLTILVRARCITMAASLLEPSLLTGIDLNPLDTFVDSYGDSFINSVNLGGEFLAAYTFRSETKEQLRSLEREIQSHGLLVALGVPMDVGVGLEDVVSDAQKSSKISVDLTYDVLGAPKPALQADEVVQYALSFSSSAIQQPALLDLTTTGYEHVPGMSEIFEPVVANRKLFTRDGGLSQQRMQLEELINQIDDTRATLRLYGIALADGQELLVAKQQAEADQHSYDAVEEAYRRSASTPLSVPDFPSLALGSPYIAAFVAEVPETTVGPWDTSLGTPFFFPFSPKTAIQNRVRLTGLALETGRQLDKLSLHYGSRDLQQDRLEVHGGDRGKPSGDLVLAEGEGVTEIRAEFGTHLDKLFITTDRGRLGGGGDAGDQHHPVVWQKAVDEVVLGFSGRSDDDPLKGAVYALRAIVARFDGISWEKSDSLAAPTP